MTSNQNPLLVPDIVSHVLLPMLDDASVIVLGFTSLLHRSLCRPRTRLHPRKQKRILYELYECSPLVLLRWFSQYLRYPVFPEIMSGGWISTMIHAARGCNWEVIRHLIPPDKHFHSDEVHPDMCYVIHEAASIGSVDLLRYLRSCGITLWDDTVSCNAAAEGHLAVLEYAFENDKVLSTAFICSVSADAIYAAACGNQFQIVKWLHTSKGFPLGDSALGAAAANNLEMLQWIVAHGGVLSYRVASEAAQKSNATMLRWLISNGCPLDSYCTGSACASGSIECLQILRDAGCPWDEQTLHAVVYGDRAGVLAWALQHGCPYDQLLVPSAVRIGSLRVLDVLFDRSIPADPAEIWQAALKSKSTKVLRYLRDKWNLPGVDCAGIAVYAASKGHLEMLQWAFEQEGSDRVKLDASRIRSEAVLEWLQKNHPLAIRQ